MKESAAVVVSMAYMPPSNIRKDNFLQAVNLHI
jgi:hypothetical protein